MHSSYLEGSGVFLMKNIIFIKILVAFFLSILQLIWSILEKQEKTKHKDKI